MTTPQPTPDMPLRSDVVRRVFGIVATAVLALTALIVIASPAAQALDLTSAGQQVTNAPYEAVGMRNADGSRIQPADDGQVLASGQDGQILAEPAPGTGSNIPKAAACAATTSKAVDPMNCLPVYRWASAMDLHTDVAFRLTEPGPSIDANIVQKTSMTWVVVAGNFAWMLAAMMLNLVTNYSIADVIARPINGFAGTIGRGMFDSPLVFLVVGAGIVIAIVSAWRRGGQFQFKRLGIILGALAATLAMTYGATQDTGQGADYKPGTMSPAWIVQKVNGTLNTIANPIATSIQDSTSANSSTVFSDAAKKDPYSCASYIDTLNKGYTNTYLSKGTKPSAGPIAVSNWWVETSYRMFADYQYGSHNSLGADYALCHQLDSNAGVTGANHAATYGEALNTHGGAATFIPDGTSRAVAPTAGDNMLSGRQMVYWGLCGPDQSGKSNFKLRGGMGDGVNGGKIGGAVTQDACAQFLTGKGAGGDWKDKPGALASTWDAVKPGFDIGRYSSIPLYIVGDNETLTTDGNWGTDTTPAAASNFALNSTGAARDASPVGPLVTSISSVVGAAVVIFLAAALFVMKTLSYLMALFFIIVALAAMLTQGQGSAGSFAKQWFGYTLVTSLASVLLSVVFQFATTLVNMGEIFIGGFPLGMAIWTGIAPAFSVLLLNWIFRKIFKSASPFTVKGMQSFANSAPGVAVAAAGGTEAVRQIAENRKDRLKKGSVEAGRKALSNAVSRVRGKGGQGDEGMVGDALAAGTAAASSTGVSSSSATKNAVDATAATTAGVSTGISPEDAAAGVASGAALGAGGAGDKASSLSDRISAFGEQSRAKSEIRGDAISGMFGGVKSGLGNLRGMDPRLVAGTAAGIAGTNIANGVKHLDDKIHRGVEWARNNKGDVARYAVGTSARAVGRLVTNPANYKKALKAAALYGGVGLATGGIGVPAAVFGAKALVKHRAAVAAGTKSAMSSLGKSSADLYAQTRDTYALGAGQTTGEAIRTGAEDSIAAARIRRSNAALGKAGLEPSDFADYSKIYEGLERPEALQIEKENESLRDLDESVAAQLVGTPHKVEVSRQLDRTAPVLAHRQSESLKRDFGGSLGVLNSSGEPMIKAPVSTGRVEPIGGTRIEGGTVAGAVSAPVAAAPVDGGTIAGERIQGEASESVRQVAGDQVVRNVIDSTPVAGPMQHLTRMNTVEHAQNTRLEKGADQVTEVHHQQNVVGAGGTQIHDSFEHRKVGGTVSAAPVAAPLSGSGDAPAAPVRKIEGDKLPDRGFDPSQDGAIANALGDVNKRVGIGTGDRKPTHRAVDDVIGESRD